MKEQLNNVKERLTNLNNNIIEMLDYADTERKVNIYLDHIWEITRLIRNTIGSPNSRKN